MQVSRAAWTRIKVFDMARDYALRTERSGTGNGRRKTDDEDSVDRVQLIEST